MLVEYTTRLFTDPWNPTMACGVAAYAAALGGCAWAWATSSWRGGGRLFWLVLTVTQLLLLLDLRLSIRHDITAALGSAAHQGQWCAQRKGAQTAAAVVVGLLLALAVVASAVRLRRRGGGAEALALGATAVSLAIFALCVISLHRVDALFTIEVGPVYAIALLWLAAGIATAVAGAWAAMGAPSTSRAGAARG